jgi:ABC-type transport system involved in multi-copper enzyme maturation permease subunit
VIQPDQFPDRLFAPPKKKELMLDGKNPVYDKEIHSEIFSQGTLMLRLVIQSSMLLAIPLMGVFLFWQIERCAWFSVYVVVFNMLVGPVFLAGSMTSERERQTLDLLLTTTLTSWQILWGKFIVGFRISAVLTGFLLWPLLLGTALNASFWSNGLAVILFFAVVVLVCLVNATIAQTCSLFTRKTSIALMSTYVILLLLYVAPPTVTSLMEILNLPQEKIASARWLGVSSPFTALFSIPLDQELSRANDGNPARVGDLRIVAGYFAFSFAIVLIGAAAMVLRLRSRRGLSE